MKVDLIYDDDCPNVGEARAELLEAFRQTGIEPRWQEWQRSDEASPVHVRRYGSPTVLVEGVDVAPMDTLEGEGCCRLYSDEGGARRTPSAEQIATGLRRAMANARAAPEKT